VDLANETSADIVDEYIKTMIVEEPKYNNEVKIWPGSSPRDHSISIIGNRMKRLLLNWKRRLLLNTKVSGEVRKVTRENHDSLGVWLSIGKKRNENEKNELPLLQ